MINTPALNIKTRSSEQLLPTPRKKILGDRISVLLIIIINITELNYNILLLLVFPILF